jgi:hypothetical protein
MVRRHKVQETRHKAQGTRHKAQIRRFLVIMRLPEKKHEVGASFGPFKQNRNGLTNGTVPVSPFQTMVTGLHK